MEEKLINYIYLVYSLDLVDDILYSTDGKYVISWNLCTFQMMIKTQVFNDDHVEELAVVDNQSCEALKVAYEIPVIVTRSSSDVKVCEIFLWIFANVRTKKNCFQKTRTRVFWSSGVVTIYRLRMFH